MNSGNQKDQKDQKDQAEHKDSSHHLRFKKDNTFVPNNTGDSEDKQKSDQDNQPQWKMSGPKRGKYEPTGGYGDYYDPYYAGGYFNDMAPAMGMMAYPYDYIAWSPDMYQYPSNYYKGPKPFFKKRKNNFGYEQAAKSSKPKVIFVPVGSKPNENGEGDENSKNDVNEEKKTNPTQQGDTLIREPASTVAASEYTNLEKARFFIIKSYSEEDVYKSINNNLWCSTFGGNQKLNDAFIAANAEFPILLFFSVNGSGLFLGVCQMKSTVDFGRNFDGWNQNHKWKGSFEISWIYIKDIPNQELRHLKNDLNEGKPVTNSRDTQEIPNDIGVLMLETFEKYQNESSILDYSEYYETEKKKP